MVQRRTVQERINKYSEKRGTCIEWIGDKVHDGYGRIWYDGKTRRVHRVVWLLVHGDWPNGPLLHSCDNRACINIEHLSIGTNKQNSEEMVQRNHSRRNHKDKHPRTKISMKDKWLIYNSTLTRAELARMYNVSWTCIDAIMKKPLEYFT